VICVFCSRTLKFMGRSNPNCRYRTVSDTLLESIDSEAKAYLLGWLASDGSLSRTGVMSIAVHKRDESVLHSLRAIVSNELPIRRKGRDLVILRINSRAMLADVCRWLGIAPGKKSRTVRFPDLGSDELGWAFLRGYFDGDGSVSSVNAKRTSPRCSIASSSPAMREGIREFCKVRCSDSGAGLEWNGTNALDLLSKLYDGASIWLARKRDAYLDWASWVPSLSGPGNHGRELVFRWTRTHPDAVPPFKERASDSGYDLTLIRQVWKRGHVEMFGSGIKVEPAYGWYFDVVPRSSIIKLGSILANSVGVIDRAYRGEILVPLMKVDPGAPDLPLPCRVVQMVPRPILHPQLVEVETVDETSREGRGFGSSGGHRGAGDADPA
jgi:deoxyuridine 5'-triphosphate nucleotidohydrolase